MNLNIKLPENPRIWLCGVTGDREKDIDELTKDIYQYFDGLIWVDHFSKDNTAKILEERKGNGKIVFRKYTEDHDLQRNEFLRAGVMKSLDYFIYIDSGERLNVEWCKNLRKTVKYYQNNGVGVGMFGRPYLLQYFDDMIFSGNPHCWPSPMRGKIEELDSLFIKKKEMGKESGLLHPFNYFWNTPRSNEIFAQYRKYGDRVVKHHENLRFQFRLYWQQNMGREFTNKSVEEYFQEIYNDKSKIDPVFFEYMELEHFFADFFRLKILKHKWPDDFLDTNRRFSWSFKEWYNIGDEIQLIPKRTGTIPMYDKEFNVNRDEPSTYKG